MGRWSPQAWFTRLRTVSPGSEILEAVQPSWLVGAQPASWSRLPFSRRELRESTQPAGGLGTTSVLEVTAEPGYYVDVLKVWSDVVIQWRRDATPTESGLPATIWQDPEFSGSFPGYTLRSGAPMTAALTGDFWDMDATYERGAIPAFGPWMRVYPGKTLTMANATENTAHQIQVLVEVVRVG